MDAVKAGDASVVNDSSELVTELLHAATLFRQRLAEFLEQFGLSEGRYAVLTELYRAGTTGLSQAELAELLLQSESNISSLVERLQVVGLVDRRWSDEDRRKRILMLTIDGRGLIQKVSSAHRRWSDSLLARLDSQDRQALTLAMKRLTGKSTAQAWKGPRLTTAGPEAPGRRDPAPDAGGPQSPRVALGRILSTLGLLGEDAK